MGFQKSPILPNKLSYFVSKVDEKSGSGRRASRRAMTILSRVEVETQGNGNIGNKPGFFACFVSKKQ